MPPAPGEQPLQHDECPSWINADLMREVLEDGATVLRVDAQPAVGKGENYFSSMYRAHVEFHTADSEEVRVRKVIAKGMPVGEFMAMYAEESCAFEREASMYGEVLPRMYAFADSKLGNDSFKTFSADYYKTSRPNTIILDDLKQYGFSMASRRDRLDLTHTKLVVQNLARFHALSTAYSEKHPDYMNQFQDKMFNETSRPRLKLIYTHLFKIFAQHVKQWEKFSHITKKFDALEEIYVDKLIKVCKLKEEGRKVLAHGDCWVNNFMFKYGDEDEPIDFRFVDFQLSRVASPALDLNYFLFTSPKVEVRVQHLEELLQEYCDVFEHWARALGFTGAPVTVEEIRKEMDQMIVFAFTATISTMVSMLKDPEDASNVETLTEAEVGVAEDPGFSNVCSSARFREAFENLLPYFDERGAFD